MTTRSQFVDQAAIAFAAAFVSAMPAKPGLLPPAEGLDDQTKDHLCQAAYAWAERLADARDKRGSHLMPELVPNGGIGGVILTGGAQ